MGLFDFSRKKNAPESASAADLATFDFRIKRGDCDLTPELRDATSGLQAPKGTSFEILDQCMVRVTARDKEKAEACMDAVSGAFDEYLKGAFVANVNIEGEAIVAALPEVVKTVKLAPHIKARVGRNFILAHASTEDEARKAVEAVFEAIAAKAAELDAAAEAEADAKAIAEAKAAALAEVKARVEAEARSRAQAERAAAAATIVKAAPAPAAPAPAAAGARGACSFCGGADVPIVMTKGSRAICPDCAKLARKVVNASTPRLPDGRRRSMSGKPNTRPCDFCGSLDYACIIGGAAAGICDRCADVAAAVPAGAPAAAASAATAATIVQAASAGASAAAPADDDFGSRIFEAIRGGAINRPLRELRARLASAPRDEEALRLARLALHQGTLRTSKETVEPALLRERLFDPVYCQCDRCHLVWVPNPAYDVAGMVQVSNPIGGTCPSCGKTFCRNHFGPGFSCPDCGVALEAAKKPNGRRHVKLVDPRTIASMPERLGVGHILLVGSGFEPSRDDLDIVEAGGYLKDARYGRTARVEAWTEVEEGRSRSLHSWSAYLTEAALSAEGSVSEQLAFNDGKTFFLWRTREDGARALDQDAPKSAAMSLDAAQVARFFDSVIESAAQTQGLALSKDEATYRLIAEKMPVSCGSCGYQYLKAEKVGIAMGTITRCPECGSTKMSVKGI